MDILMAGGVAGKDIFKRVTPSASIETGEGFKSLYVNKTSRSSGKKGPDFAPNSGCLHRFLSSP